MHLSMYTIFVLIALTSYIWGGNAVTTPPPGMNDPYLGGPGKPRPVRRMRPSPSQQQQRRKQLEEEQQDQQQQEQQQRPQGLDSMELGYSEVPLQQAPDDDGHNSAPPLPSMPPPPQEPEATPIQLQENLTAEIAKLAGKDEEKEKENKNGNGNGKDASSALNHIQESKTREELRYRPVIVGICGGTGSGKTTLTKAIVERLGAEHVSLISHDSYYKDLQHLTVAERANVNFDHPDALDSTLLHKHLCKLKEGLPVKCPVYDFTTHSRQMHKYEMVNPSKIVLVDGILIFAESCLLDSMDMKIFVDTADDIRLIRRLTRDVAERARTVDSVIGQYHATVRSPLLTPTRG